MRTNQKSTGEINGSSSTTCSRVVKISQRMIKTLTKNIRQKWRLTFRESFVANFVRVSVEFHVHHLCRKFIFESSTFTLSIANTNFSRFLVWNLIFSQSRVHFFYFRLPKTRRALKDSKNFQKFESVVV